MRETYKVFDIDINIVPGLIRPNPIIEFNHMISTPIWLLRYPNPSPPSLPSWSPVMYYWFPGHHRKPAGAPFRPLIINGVPVLEKACQPLKAKEASHSERKLTVDGKELIRERS